MIDSSHTIVSCENWQLATGSYSIFENSPDIMKSWHLASVRHTENISYRLGFRRLRLDVLLLFDACVGTEALFVSMSIPDAPTRFSCSFQELGMEQRLVMICPCS